MKRVKSWLQRSRARMRAWRVSVWAGMGAAGRILADSFVELTGLAALVLVGAGGWMAWPPLGFLLPGSLLAAYVAWGVVHE